MKLAMYLGVTWYEELQHDRNDAEWLQFSYFYGDTAGKLVVTFQKERLEIINVWKIPSISPTERDNSAI